MNFGEGLAGGGVSLGREGKAESDRESGDNGVFHDVSLLMRQFFFARLASSAPAMRP